MVVVILVVLPILGDGGHEGGYGPCGDGEGDGCAPYPEAQGEDGAHAGGGEGEEDCEGVREFAGGHLGVPFVGNPIVAHMPARYQGVTA